MSTSPATSEFSAACNNLLACLDKAATIPPIGLDKADVAATIARLRQVVIDLRDKPLQVFQLVVMGEFKSGKSSFINLCLGEDLAPTADAIETGVISIFQHAPRREARLVFREGEPQVCPIPAAIHVIQEKKEDESFLRQLRFAEFFVDAGFLRLMWN